MAGNEELKSNTFTTGMGIVAGSLLSFNQEFDHRKSVYTVGTGRFVLSANHCSLAGSIPG
jgi:hypothetical protein